MKLSDIAGMLGQKLIGPDAIFQGASLDSRHVLPGQLFIAIKGEHVDGHDFLSQAQEQGAIGALASRPVDSSLSQIIVPDVRLALGEIARYYRNQLTMPIVGLTGSCGKTTTKTLMKQIFAEVGKVHATQGTLNNDYGMPLTLLNAANDDDFVVLEMGANHPQEIAYLTAIARPTIALITNAGPVHLEGFLSVEGVARAKGEIFAGLTEKGVAIINLDDVFADYWRKITTNHAVLTFGLKNKADISASAVRSHADDTVSFTLHTPSATAEVHLPLIGQHNVMNALAAAAAAIAVGVSIDKICQGLHHAQAVDKRLVPRAGLNGMALIDDTYNANPLAMEMAINVLSQMDGEKVLVTGDMAELGEKAQQYHRELGIKARLAGVHRLYAVGELSAQTIAGFGEGGQHFQAQSDLIKALQVELKPSVRMLVKGSRSAQMENVVKALLPPEKPVC